MQKNLKKNGLLFCIFSNLINSYYCGVNDDLLSICSLVEDYDDQKKWIFFCEDETIINLPGLVKVLNKYDARKVSFFSFLSTMNINVNVVMLMFGLLSFPNCKEH